MAEVGDGEVCGIKDSCEVDVDCFEGWWWWLLIVWHTVIVGWFFERDYIRPGDPGAGADNVNVPVRAEASRLLEEGYLT